MKKLLYLLLLTPIIYFSSCSKSNSNEDYAGYNCVDGSCVGVFTNPQYLSLNSCDSLCGVIFGCTDPLANNFNPLATVDDSSCIYSLSTQACQDHLTAENIFNDVGHIIEVGLQDNGQSKACPNYNLMNSDISNIDTLIIDFGSTNCLHNGKLRRGRINITYTGKYRDAYSVITSTFDNYYVNDNLVQGERVVTNQGINSNGNMWFTIDINNASIATANGIINWNSNRVREWVNGENTYTFTDDVYKITGSASGNAVNGHAFSMQITNPLEVDFACLPSCLIKSGEAILSPSGYYDRIINYGNLICDCNVDVTINGSTFPIVIEN
jgi:hypothetical protein